MNRKTIACATLLFALCTAASAEDVPRPEPVRVQAAVDAGLAWLAEHQLAEGRDAGSWPAPSYRTAATSFAGLAFLANGHLPGDDEYGRVVRRAMEYVRRSATPEGYLGGGNRSGMYIHAVCTLFGLSYLGMSPDQASEPELADWCRRSVALIVEAQRVRRKPLARGGWRYTPFTNESDVSVTSWQLLTLHTARQCGYEVDDGVFENALAYIDRAYHETEEEAGFLYRPGVSARIEPAATGVAVFVKSLLQRGHEERIAASLVYLRRYPPTWGGPQYGGYYYFAAFYMSQGMFQVGGEVWEEYAARLETVLLAHMAGDGRWPFPPDNTPQSRLAGDAYPAAMAVLLLSLEKQYLPMYQRQSALPRFAQ